MNIKTNQQARSCETDLERLVDCMFHKTVTENVDPFLRDCHQVPLVQSGESNEHVQQNSFCSIWQPFPFNSEGTFTTCNMVIEPWAVRELRSTVNVGGTQTKVT